MWPLTITSDNTKSQISYWALLAFNLCSSKSWIKSNLSINRKKLSQVENREVKTFFIQIDFESIKDKQQFELFNLVSTSLALPAKQVDKLRDEGGKLLRSSPEFKKLLIELKWKSTCALAAIAATATFFISIGAAAKGLNGSSNIVCAVKDWSKLGF